MSEEERSQRAITPHMLHQFIAFTNGKFGKIDVWRCFRNAEGRKVEGFSKFGIVRAYFTELFVGIASVGGGKSELWRALKYRQSCSGLRYL
ncbi:hypothetical protein [Agrobacterium pusense]|uniref:hypothetical protein n=1 Tax=Agrobacterium pusense TaxID=648995 RepID=UPI003FD052EB